MAKENFIDTDIFIHRLDPDPALNKAANKIFNNNHPSAISAFTLLELKGSYIQSLILLRRKVYESDNILIAYAKIRRTGGRESQLMFARLINWIGDFLPHPWNEAKRELLTHLDTQINNVWDSFKNSINTIYDDFECTRASESPKDEGDVWNVSIPQCRESNTKCKITEFMSLYHSELNNLINHIDNLDHSIQTKELKSIRDAAKKTINNGFPWREKICRQVGDLLIGLQSKAGSKLISSNYREHAQLHIPLGYVFEHFDVVQIRTK